MDKRKMVKITIPADKVNLFHLAKARAEDAAMMTMSDTQYAGRLFQWALEQAGQGNGRGGDDGK